MPGSPATTSTASPPTPEWEPAPPASPAQARPKSRTPWGCRSTGTTAAVEGAGQMRAVIAASLAVAAGLARHVLVYRTVTEGSAQGTGGRPGIGGSGGGGGIPRMGGFLQWSLPYGAVSAANWIAMVGQRRMHEFGTHPRATGQIALNGRRNAALNPKGGLPGPDDDGRLPGRPHDHHAAVPLRLRRARATGPPSWSSRTVTWPTTSTTRRCRSTRWAPPCEVGPVWDQFDDMTTMAARDAAASMWERTELKPADVDVGAALRRLHAS